MVSELGLERPQSPPMLYQRDIIIVPMFEHHAIIIQVCVNYCNWSLHASITNGYMLGHDVVAAKCMRFKHLNDE